VNYNFSKSKTELIEVDSAVAVKFLSRYELQFTTSGAQEIGKFPLSQAV